MNFIFIQIFPLKLFSHTYATRIFLNFKIYAFRATMGEWKSKSFFKEIRCNIWKIPQCCRSFMYFFFFFQNFTSSLIYYKGVSALLFTFEIIAHTYSLDYPLIKIYINLY
jgi:hypothetical protein